MFVHVFMYESNRLIHVCFFEKCVAASCIETSSMHDMKYSTLNVAFLHEITPKSLKRGVHITKISLKRGVHIKLSWHPIFMTECFSRLWPTSSLAARHCAQTCQIPGHSRKVVQVI